jgi:predicted amidohydrolase YtcJ
MDDDVAEARGLRIENGRISGVHVGEPASEQPADVLLDFGGRVIMPGFLDGHAHIEVGATAASGVDCRVPTVSSIDDILGSFADRLPEAEARGGWLVGQGNLFLDQKLSDGRLPDRHDLDKVSTDVAIVIQAGGHVSCVNSKAIELAGLHEFRSTQSVMGGPVVERGPDGRPTGIIGELDSALPIPPLSQDQLTQVLRNGAQDLFLAHGVTHVAEISQTLQGVRTLDALTAAGDPVPRLSLALWAPGTLSLADAVAWQETLQLQGAPDLIAVTGVKIFTDGGFSAGTAAMVTDYVGRDVDPSAPRGKLAMTPAAMEETIRTIVDAGLQPFVHTCGELATQVVAQVSQGIGNGRPETQVRVEHAGHLLVEPDKTLGLMSEAGIRPMPNPGFIHAIGSALLDYVGEPARGRRFLFRDMLERGFRISGSSDIHVGSHPQQTNPFFMMWCSIARVGFDGAPVDPEQAIGIGDALRMHTTHAAEALGVADRQGSIAPGKDADVIVLDRDPRTVPVDQLPDVKVDFVFVGGRCVYERPGARPPIVNDAREGSR